ncbi:hypothetical protein CTA2_11017 [Colletotrichum tanaceti]|uniref:Zn(2)-C6 fungal-type domain-containing protein n=1 Tax=Colletotrichum tanaceti TaxID=1306861 RepID=A0A4U6X365_9PEZI|nr:hypothetical protein CTA2_11017 [Colletotrichum tanaceti]TKW49818.1 hypothetical protein CTA1_10869 [Colletotrichum tanaceti]
MDGMDNNFGLTASEMDETMAQFPFDVDFNIPDSEYNNSAFYLGLGTPAAESSFVPGMSFYQQDQEQYVDPQALEKPEPTFWDPALDGEAFQQQPEGAQLPEAATFSHAQGLEEAAFSHAQGPDGSMTLEQVLTHYLPRADDFIDGQLPIFVDNQSQEPRYYFVGPRDNVEEGAGEGSGAARNDVENVVVENAVVENAVVENVVAENVVVENVVENVAEEEVAREASGEAALADRVLAPNTKGNRVAKKARKPPSRAVKANSCERCRSSKTKCVREEGAASCQSCLKKGVPCHVLGTDGRTNKTNKDRLEAASLAVENFFRDGILLCKDVAQRRLADFGDEKLAFVGPMVRSMSDYQMIRNCLPGQIEQKPMVDFGSGLFRPFINYHDAKLSETRTVHIPMIKQLALVQGEILACLINMVVFGSPSHLAAANDLISRLLHYRNNLGAIQHRVQKYFPSPGEPRDVFEQVRQGVEQRLQKALE